MAERIYCGLDLGGTCIKAGVVRAADRKLLSSVSVETCRQRGPNFVIGRLIEAAGLAVAEAGLQMERVAGIGVGTPGPLSHRRGVVFQTSNLPGWVCEPVVERIREGTGRPATLENDGNAAAWGEFWAGAGSDVDSLAVLTLGTGIGAGIILQGRLIRGGRENGGELGHMIVQAGGRPCTCGQRGCLETYASAHKLALRFAEALSAGETSSVAVAGDEEITSVQIAEAARAGDPLASRIWDEACYYLAIGCVNITRICNPDRILLGGGLINAGKQLLLKPVREKFALEDWRLACPEQPLAPDIRFASLNTEAGLIGAAGAVELAIEEGLIHV